MPFLLLLAGALVWPAVVALNLWRSRRFHRVARKASGWSYRIVADGVGVWRGAEAPRQISWAQLQKGRWFVHSSPTMASGDEELYAVDLLEEGLALSGYAEELLPLLNALCEREFQPKLENGGRALGAGGWLMTMLWLGAAALLVGLFYVWSGASG